MTYLAHSSMFSNPALKRSRESRRRSYPPLVRAARLALR